MIWVKTEDTLILTDEFSIIKLGGEFHKEAYWVRAHCRNGWYDISEHDRLDAARVRMSQIQDQIAKGRLVIV
jgi:hypothetical protein